MVNVDVLLDGRVVGQVTHDRATGWWCWTPTADAPEAARRMERCWRSRTALRVGILRACQAVASRMSEVAT